MNSTLSSTISSNNLDYIPCSMVEPNTANRCSNPEDANWAAPGVYFNWAWNGYLLGAPMTGPDGGTVADWIDKTLSYGFGRVKGMLPANTFGGYPGEGFFDRLQRRIRRLGAGQQQLPRRGHPLAGVPHQQRPGRAVLLVGGLGPAEHDDAVDREPPVQCGGGASPHSWGIAMGDLGLLDSLVSQRTDGSLIVGRGVPNSWVASGGRIAVSNFPTTDGRRIGVTITTRGDAVTLQLTGKPSGPVTFELPAFVNNIASTSAGTVDNGAGAVTIPAHTRSVTVTLAHVPAAS